jgi:hypothetical protein
VAEYVSGGGFDQIVQGAIVGEIVILEANKQDGGLVWPKGFGHCYLELTFGRMPAIGFLR